MLFENELRATIEAGDTAFGAQCMTHSPAIVEVYGDLGLDFVWIDFEHIGPSPFDGGTFEHLVRAANVADTDLLVRLPKPDPALIRKVLDTGVRNVLVPRIEAAEEVQTAVDASRFHRDGAVGDRGIGAVRANTWGADLSDEYLEHEDDNAMVGVMIETAAAVENLESILGVEDLGFVFVGPNDLALSLGYPNELDVEPVQRTIDRVRREADDRDVPVGLIAEDVERIRDLREAGVGLVRVCGGEVAAIRDQVAPTLESLSRPD